MIIKGPESWNRSQVQVRQAEEPDQRDPKPTKVGTAEDRMAAEGDQFSGTRCAT